LGRKRPPDKLSEDEIPPSSDPRWSRWADRIAPFLLIPRTATELRRLIPEFSFAVIVNTLSWMDLQGRAQRLTSQKPTLWALASVPAPPPPPPKRCPRCGGMWTRSETGIICIYCGRSPPPPLTLVK